MSSANDPLRDVFQRLWHHTIAFAAIDGKPRERDVGSFSGMGSLVLADGPCILTAAHVWEAVRGLRGPTAGAAAYEQIGIRWGSEYKGRLLATSHIAPRAWPRPAPDWGEWGPDVALLGLSDLDATDLMNRGKIFFDLDKPRGGNVTSTLWTIIGAPAEEVTATKYGEEARTHLYASKTVSAFERDGFDYVEIPAHYGKEGRSPSLVGGRRERRPTAIASPPGRAWENNRSVSSHPDYRRFTVREYLRLAEVGILRPDEKVELIDGQIVAMSPQGPVHSALVARIVTLLLGVFPRDRFCIRPQSTLAAGEDYAPEPDVAVVAGRCEEHEKDLPRTALLVIEVAEASLRLDRGRKSDLYARAGVPEYWVVDVAGRVLETRREPSEAGYKLIRILGPGDVLTPLALEGQGIPPLHADDLLPVGR